MREWLYIFSNPSMPGLVKIGFTRKDPQNRGDELYSTGVPTPFELVYDVLVEDAHLLEKSVHNSASKKRCNKSREFFSMTPKDAIEFVKNIILQNATYVIAENIYLEYDKSDRANLLERKSLDVTEDVKHVVSELCSSLDLILEKIETLKCEETINQIRSTMYDYNVCQELEEPYSHDKLIVQIVCELVKHEFPNINESAINNSIEEYFKKSDPATDILKMLVFVRDVNVFFTPKSVKDTEIYFKSPQLILKEVRMLQCETTLKSIKDEIRQNVTDSIEKTSGLFFSYAFLGRSQIPFYQTIIFYLLKKKYEQDVKPEDEKQYIHNLRTNVLFTIESVFSKSRERDLERRNIIHQIIYVLHPELQPSGNNASCLETFLILLFFLFGFIFVMGLVTKLVS